MPYEYHRDGFTLSTDPDRLDIDSLHAFLAHESYWAAGIAREVLKRAIAHSLCFGLYAGDLQAGFARVISDYATYAYLSDVYILAPYRGQGLATWMLTCILAHPDLQGLRRFSLTTKDAQPLYQRCGFTALVYPQRHMERLDPEFYAAMTGGDVKRET
jgi:GNAT superfamily N-acetyltransferase